MQNRFDEKVAKRVKNHLKKEHPHCSVSLMYLDGIGYSLLMRVERGYPLPEITRFEDFPVKVEAGDGD